MTYKDISINKARLAFLALALLMIATIIDEIIVIALMFAIIAENFSTLAIAWLFFCQMVPAILVAPFSGALIDYYGARRMLLVFGLSQMAVIIWLSLAQTLFEIYLISALLSFHVAFTGPAIFSLFVPMSKLANLSVSNANILLEVTRSVGTIIGPAVGGLAIGLMDIQYTILAAAFWFGLTVITIYFMKIDTIRATNQRLDFK